MEALSIYINNWVIPSNMEHRLNDRIRLADELHKNLAPLIYYYDRDDSFLRTYVKDYDINLDAYTAVLQSIFGHLCGPRFRNDFCYDYYPPIVYHPSWTEKERKYLTFSRHSQATFHAMFNDVLHDIIFPVLQTPDEEVSKVFERILPYI